MCNAKVQMRVLQLEQAHRAAPDRGSGPERQSPRPATAPGTTRRPLVAGAALAATALAFVILGIG